MLAPAKKSSKPSGAEPASFWHGWHGWRERYAPSAEILRQMGAQLFAQLPEPFRAACGNLDIRVEEFAEEAVLDALEIESPFELMGLYHGAPLPQKSHLDPVSGPDQVCLYRRPILDYWAEHEETLEHIVRHILIHEIGHHFGLSDARMTEIEEAANTNKGHK